MSSSQAFLLALRPPSNIERDLDTLKSRLFSEFGLLSAIAIEPLLPVAFLPDAAPRPPEEALPRGLEFDTEGWSTQGSSLFLAVRSSIDRATVHEALRVDDAGGAVAGGSAPGESAPGGADLARPARPFPPFSGIYLSELGQDTAGESFLEPVRGESVPSEAAVMAAVGEAPGLHWNGGDLVLLSYRFDRWPQWWNSVRCEELWRIRLRKRGREGR